MENEVTQTQDMTQVSADAGKASAVRSAASDNAQDGARSTLIQIRDLCVTYGSDQNAFNAVDHLSVDIRRNELTFVFGASGCGKTTLLNVIGGMSSPSSGTVIFDGQDISHMNSRRMAQYRRDSVGFIFQHYNLIAGLTARENIAVSSSMTPGSTDPIETLALVGLEDKADAYPNKLSGGQQQRVCIARAVCKKAPLILADEPTGALDVESACTVMEILSNLVRKHGCTVVMVTHNPDLAPMADRVITMSDGAIVQDERISHPQTAAECLMRSGHSQPTHAS